MNRLYIVLLLMIGFFGCIDGGNSSAVNAAADPDSVIIPLSEITTSVKHYTHNVGGVNVKYFLVKGTDGTVRSAFDACEVCYQSKKGYTQVGSDVRCNNCGLMFSIDGLGSKNKGKGCWPAYLPHEISGENVVIKKSDLEAGAYLFS